MNRDYVLWNLREAVEALGRVIDEIAADPEYSREQLEVEIAHLYHHLNTAWNARDVSAGRVQACSAEDFKTWRQFPPDIDMEPGVE